MRIEETQLTPVWVNSEHLLTTARYVLEGHRLKAVGVVDSGRFAGILRLDALAGRLGTEVVEMAKEAPEIVLRAGVRIEQAAEVFVTHDLEWAPVLDGDRYLGMITSNLLLRELRRSRDPLTGLPWSDRLREWGAEQLGEHREITIAFFDLDEFGLYNKRFGHIVGDKVLKGFVDGLRAFVDPERDVLVRYGGDEFVLGTLRTVQEVHVLVREFTQAMSRTEIPESPEPVTFAVGISGGRRTKEREVSHYAATLDNLINLASKDCQRHKRPTARVAGAEAKRAQPMAHRPVTELPRVVSVHDSRRAEGSLVTVILATGEVVVSGVYTRSDESMHKAVALATLEAAARLYPDMEATLEDVFHEEADDGERYVTVTGRLVQDAVEMVVSGVKLVRNDVGMAVAEASLEAFIQ